MNRHLLAVVLCLTPLMAGSAWAQDRSEAEKLALAKTTCNRIKAPKFNQLRPIAMILVSKQDEPLRAYVCMVAPKYTTRYKVQVNHVLFGNDGLVQLVGDNSESCRQQSDPVSGPLICRKKVRRFVTEGSRLLPNCRMLTTEPPVPEAAGCTSTPYKFAGRAEIFTIWQPKLIGPSVRRQWLVPVRQTTLR